ncbi:MAG: hypothetical protein RL095_307 [Verrucomicrobiota bacterium]|jgi:hypothetical protein
MNIHTKLLGRALNDIRLFRDAQEIGFDYIVNPETGELHYVHLANFAGSHNLASADLGSFIGLFNLGVIPIHKFKDGTEIPIYDAESGVLLGPYRLNKCQHCRFPIFN